MQVLPVKPGTVTPSGPALSEARALLGEQVPGPSWPAVDPCRPTASCARVPALQRNVVSICAAWYQGCVVAGPMVCGLVFSLVRVHVVGPGVAGGGSGGWSRLQRSITIVFAFPAGAVGGALAVWLVSW
jgi:hypothetical protein